MSEVSGVGARRHFSNEEEEALRQDESTRSIVKRDTKTNVEIYGTDRSWVAVKEHQKGHVGSWGAAEIAHAAFDGAELSGLLHFGAAGPIGGALAGLVLGIHQLKEAHENGEAQARALAKDNVHVALIGALDLPASYKATRLEGEYRHVAKEPNSPATTMMGALLKDTKGMATLQLHADRGMNAARDLSRSGMTAEAFLNANPKIAERYRQDAAFREGFGAYLHAKAHLPANELRAFEQKLDARDGWYAQSQVSFRV